MDALFRVPAPANEPVLGYAPGSSERATLEGELARIGVEQIDLPSTIGGRKVMGGGRAKLDLYLVHAKSAMESMIRSA